MSDHLHVAEDYFICFSSTHSLLSIALVLLKIFSAVSPMLLFKNSLFPCVSIIRSDHKKAFGAVLNSL